ncbi:hypothetical protein VPH35_139498 [Triticum aestivum]|uniref:Uncharacterized protein n=1 Tax=Aegilops tauschii TaxID=37682 RepID=R7W6M2_AEGTA
MMRALESSRVLTPDLSLRDAQRPSSSAPGMPQSEHHAVQLVEGRVQVLQQVILGVYSLPWLTFRSHTSSRSMVGAQLALAVLLPVGRWTHSAQLNCRVRYRARGDEHRGKRHGTGR